MYSLFLGDFEHTIDEKGRLTIPAKFRERLQGGLVVTKGIEPCLAMYPADTFGDLETKIQQLDRSELPVRDIRRLIFGGAAHLAPDRQGRVNVPVRLREYANIDKEAVIVGVGDHCEIWNRESWEARQDGKLNDAEWRAEQLLHLDL